MFSSEQQDMSIAEMLPCTLTFAPNILAAMPANPSAPPALPRSVGEVTFSPRPAGFPLDVGLVVGDVQLEVEPPSLCALPPSSMMWFKNKS